jgi:hypothetical protein
MRLDGPWRVRDCHNIPEELLHYTTAACGHVGHNCWKIYHRSKSTVVSELQVCGKAVIVGNRYHIK